MKRFKRTSMLACTLCFFIAVTTGCGNKTTDDTDNSSVNTEQSVAETTQAEPQMEATEPQVAEADSIINSKYAKEITDEIDGQTLTFEASYTFLEGNTGIYCRNFASDEIHAFSWDDSKIYFCDNTSYNYTIEGDVLKIDGGAGISEFPKKVETDPILNGDFSAFAGTYQATAYADEYSGGEGIVDLELSADGRVSGGYERAYYYSETIPNITPMCVEKLTDGSYFCILAVFPNDDDDYHEDDSAELDGWVEFGYHIYPKDVATQFSNEPDYSSDYAYVELFQCDGGVGLTRFYKVQ